MRKNLLRIILTTLVIVLFLLIFGKRSEGQELDLEGTYYEARGCIYLNGSLTEKERTTNLEAYKERMNERGEQIEASLNRQHDITIEKIRAKAMENYLIAQSLYYDEVIEAIYGQEYNASVYIENVNENNVDNAITNTNESTTDNINTNENTNTNANTNRNNLTVK